MAENGNGNGEKGHNGEQGHKGQDGGHIQAPVVPEG